MLYNKTQHNPISIMTLCVCFGTRPEYIKVKPIIQQYPGPMIVCYTGQHETLIQHEAIPQIDYNLGAVMKSTGNRLNDIMIHILNAVDVFQHCCAVLIQGDTTTALAMALSAYHHHIPIIHLEAGLRTHNTQDPFPEEANRKLISAISSLHLCPTPQNEMNLTTERCGGLKKVVGNTGLDGLCRSGCSYGKTVIVTMHRRENLDLLPEWFNAIEQCAKSYPTLLFILPMHPNPQVQKWKYLLQQVEVMDPVPHNEFVNMIKTCRFIISDSGGLQEECAYYNKKIIVCRKTTERPESLGKQSYLCNSPTKLKEMVEHCQSNYECNHLCPYGDGFATNRIIPIIQDFMKSLCHGAEASNPNPNP